MEKVPEEDPQVRVANMLGSFIRGHSYFAIGDDGEIPEIIIFRNEDLESLPFDENGEFEAEDLIDLLPRAIFPSYN